MFTALAVILWLFNCLVVVNSVVYVFVIGVLVCLFILFSLWLFASCFVLINVLSDALLIQ